MTDSVEQKPTHQAPDPRERPHEDPDPCPDERTDQDREQRYVPA